MDAMYPSADADVVVHLDAPAGSSTGETSQGAQGGGEGPAEDDDEGWVATHGLAGPAPHLLGR